MTLEVLKKYATQEADWLSYYGYRLDRESDPMDYKFYSRIHGIGYAKKNIDVDRRCPAVYLMAKFDIFNSKLEDLEIVSGPRDWINNIYTPLEYCIKNDIIKDELIKIVKRL
jgi:hypothetical protein